MLSGAGEDWVVVLDCIFNWFNLDPGFHTHGCLDIFFRIAASFSGLSRLSVFFWRPHKSNGWGGA